MRTALRWISITLFLLLSAFLIAFGVLYATVQNLLWFHAAAVPPAALEDVRPLYFALMKLIGGSSAALGLLGAYVALAPLRMGARFAATTLAFTYAIPFVMAAIVAESLAAQTGAPTSWHIMGVLLGVTAVAYLAHIASRGPKGG
ncbi:MAG: hypothetical protein VX640_00165 [Pseudomonadota bacterium]|nr:hypothetical protein [Pseudomonadota bacterium]